VPTHPAGLKRPVDSQPPPGVTPAGQRKPPAGSGTVQAGPQPADQPGEAGRVVPQPVLRQWSDALAAAGLFSEALRIHPAAERADVVRKAELAVLAGDHALALHLLAELKAARTARTARSRPAGLPAGATAEADRAARHPASPWLDLLTCCAQLLAGQPDRLPAVLKAATKVQPSAGVAWVVALAAAAAGDLGQAAINAEAARVGGCRDLRMLAIGAADRAAAGDDQVALELVGNALRIALPDEEPAVFVVDLLDRSGFREAAQRLAATGAADDSQPREVRAAWRVAARHVGAGSKQALRRSLTAAGGIAERARHRHERRLHDQTLRSLTCRCYGSAGWIGESRMYYVSRHLVEILPAPVAGLDARLLRCLATKLTFLDFALRQLTLPVVSEVVPNPPTAAGDLADPEGQPTPGMGVSLGIALNRP
jgi:hypothetical protein